VVSEVARTFFLSYALQFFITTTLYLCLSSMTLVECCRKSTTIHIELTLTLMSLDRFELEPLVYSRNALSGDPHRIERNLTIDKDISPLIYD